MALAYPEGECFFLRSALDSRSADGYHASNVKDFYSHMMVEYIWNVESDHGSKEAMTAQSREGKGHRHRRSGYKIVRGSWWNTDYGAWTQLPFMYGPHWEKITRRAQHNLCASGNRFRDHEKGGAAEAWFMFMPMPTKEERWVWIDLLSYIRAIYLPVAHSVNKDHPDLCSFVQVNFALSRTLKVWHGEGHFAEIKTDKVLGLKKNSDRTLALDVAGLIELLTLPRQLRRDNCYNLKLIQLRQGISLVTPTEVAKSFSDSGDKNWIDVAKGNFGLDLMWQPPQKSTWQENFIRNVLTIAIGFIPVTGPFLQILFSVGWTLVSEENPAAAFALLKNMCPGIDITDKMIEELKKSAAETRKFLPDGWEALNLQLQQKTVDANMTPKPIEKMDAMLPMLLQKEVLDATGNNPDKEQSKGSDDPGETIADTPASSAEEAGEIS